MAATTDDILKDGASTGSKDKGSGSDAANTRDSVSGDARDSDDKESTGVENVSYDTVTSKGLPVNPQGASDVMARGLATPDYPQVEPVVKVGEASQGGTPWDTGDAGPAPQAKASTDRVSVTEVGSQQKGSVGADDSQLPPLAHVLDYLEPPQTKEQREAEEKSRKRESIFAAIGDGISALSNLYFTTQYAPNSFDPTKTMSEASRARWDKIKKDHDATRDRWFDAYWRVMNQNRDDKRYQQQWEYRLKRDKIEDEYRKAAEERAQQRADQAQARSERDNKLAELRLAIMAGKVDESNAKARRAEIQAEYEAELIRSNIGKNNRSGKKGRFPWKNPRTGETEYADTKEEAIALAEYFGTLQEDTETTIREVNSADPLLGNKTQQVTTTKKNRRPAPLNSGSGGAKKSTGVNYIKP